MEDSVDILNCLSRIEKEKVEIDYTIKILINELNTLQERQNSLSNSFKDLKEMLSALNDNGLQKEKDMARELVKKEKKVIQLRNGQVNIPFEEEVNLAEFGISDIESIQFTGIDGIEWRSDKNLFKGIPNSAGEHIGYIKYKDSSSGESIEKEVHFLVNPDPRTLWNNIEPSKDEPFQKENSNFNVKEIAGRKIISASIRGKSHAHKGDFREDDFSSSIFENGWTIQVVADGAGSAMYSRKGSELACKTILDSLSQFFNSEYGQKLDQLILNNNGEFGRSRLLEEHDLIKEITLNPINVAHDALKKIADEKNSKISDFATTALFAITKDFDFGTVVISFSIGDGAIAAIHENNGDLLMQPDGGEFSGQTCFLSEPSLFLDKNYDLLKSRITVNLYPQKVDSVILMTDGISDPKFGTEHNLNDSNKWINFYQEISFFFR